MGGAQEARLVQLVEQAHPRRIARHADEWDRCGAILDQAAATVEAAASRHGEIGGQTGPAMARAFVVAASVLREKARDLQRGADALRHVADATEQHREQKRRLDRDHPDDGGHVVVREEGSRWVADGQENALRHGIAVMKSIQVGADPRTTGIPVTAPPGVEVSTPTWWPPTHLEPPTVVGLQPGDADWDDLDDWDAPSSAPAPVTASTTPGVLGSASAPPHGVPSGAALLGAGALGAGGLVAGARAAAALGGAGAAGPAGPGGGARPIGAGGVAGSGGTLGRGAGSGAGAGAGARRTSRGGTASPGVLTGGRRGSGKDDDERTRDRDLHDDGRDWLDDDTAPDVLR